VLNETMIAKLFGMRLPLAIFVLSVLIFISVGSSVIYSTLVNNLVEDGNWLHIKTDVCELIFPRGWYMSRGSSGEENNTIYIINLFSEDFETMMHLRFYSKEATRDFMKENNLTDISAIPNFEAQLLYNWSLTHSENATLYFVKEKPESVYFIGNWSRERGYETHYLLINIKKAYERNNVYYNTTGLFISMMIDQRLFEIIFYGEEQSWERNQDKFEIILDSMKIFKVSD